VLQDALAAAALGSLVTRRPIVPSAAEVEANPRSRSAKLRVFERAGGVGGAPGGGGQGGDDDGEKRPWQRRGGKQRRRD
jgi:MraW methylase family